MEATARSVLLVGSQEVFPAELSTLLRRASYYSEVVTDGREALELLRSLPFDVVIAAATGLGIELRDFVRGLRWSDSASQRGSLVILAGGAAAAAAQTLLNRGINRILAPDIGAAALVESVRVLVEASPRVPLRTLIRLQVRGGGRDGQLLCQTDNVSMTGVLVRTELTPEAGTHMRFELVVPRETEPIRGTVEVVRQASGYRERSAALGLRFVAFDGDGEHRLAALVASREAAG